MKALFLVLVLLFNVLCLQAQQGYNPELVAHFNWMNNKTFPSLELEDSSGNIIRADSLKGKTVYVDFWFINCSPCIREVPYSKSLHEFFKADTNIVFLNICIENLDRKDKWKETVKEKGLKGLQVFYARNRPQKVNLLRVFNVSFPTYVILNKDLKVIGYDAPRPSEEGFVHWSLEQAQQGIGLAESYRKMVKKTKEYQSFIASNWKTIEELRSVH
ncbi:MAG: alkyl hydroperoxide reductase/Thiol specific antioxidant/Mal allergen [Segetibacter sp.]|nr:alkyl hydroperoxide reductase/Thiol specific antioxidant/Mal allergen [Segetibacter sp.]